MRAFCGPSIKLVSLTSLSIKTVLDTSSADLVRDFFVPALTQSVRYDRGVGYFSSGWLRLAAEGMAEFASLGGRARWVTSPILDEADWEALQHGEAARHDPVLWDVLRRNVSDLAQTLEGDTLSALAWMVCDGTLDFRIALPRNKLERGNFHDKFGIFTDIEGNQVSFNGSYNDSIQGTRNYESIKVFCSWSAAYDPLVQADAERFERLWTNADPNVRVYELPDAAREDIIRLRFSERPYAAPSWLAGLRPAASARRTGPFVPDHIVLRDYQRAAIDAWIENGARGLLEMATGSGKTITALAGSMSQR
jgi:hypothetical protein